MTAFALAITALVAILTSVVSFRVGAASQQRSDVRKFAHLASVSFNSPVDKKTLRVMLNSINK
nr:MAG TPA: hypothetical protein [Caudoviricetes sp.]